MNELPDHILELGRQVFIELAEAEKQSHPLAPGAIARHRAGADGASALVLILDVDPRENLCDIVLLHANVALATENDLIIFGDETNLGYHLVAQADVRASTYTDYLETVIGTAPDEVLGALAQQGDAGQEGRRGMQLKGPLDARWDFKIAEVRRLHRLVHDFIHDLLHDKLLAEFDEQLVEALGSSEVQTTDLLRGLASMIVSNDAQFVGLARQLRLFFDNGIANQAPWKMKGGALGEKLFEVLAGPEHLGRLREGVGQTSTVLRLAEAGIELAEKG